MGRWEGGSLVITGTPGTGKSTIGRLLSRKLGIEFLDVGRLVKEEGLFLYRDERRGSVVVNPDLVLDRLVEILGDSDMILETLYPGVIPPRLVQRVVVLRCDPLILRYRLEERMGYERALENAMAEALGVVSAEAYSHFPESKIVEVDTTMGGPESNCIKILRLLQSDHGAQKRISWLDRALLLDSITSRLIEIEARG